MHTHTKEFYSFRDAVTFILDGCSVGEHECYSVRPHDYNLDRFYVSDGIAVDFGVIRYVDDTYIATYNA